MARFKTDGLDEIISDMDRMGESLNGEVADKMLLAGAEQVKIAWRNSAKKHKHRDTGAMIESIGYARTPEDVNGVRTIDIYPQGVDEKGVRNAEKAFILHYGTSKITGSHWVDDADRECDKTVIPAMRRVFEDEMRRKGVKL